MKSTTLRISILFSVLFGWLSHPSQIMGQNVDESQKFASAMELLKSGKAPPQHAIIVFQKDQVLLERYWSGPDLVYGRKKNRVFGPEELHGLRSVSKSVVGLLVGIAIDEGTLPALDTPAHELFPDLELEKRSTFTDAHRKITIEHLLNMTDGLDWQQHESKDHVNNESKLEGAKDAASYVWSQPIATVPGKTFNYNSGATALLSRAIERATKNDFKEYVKTKLFSPLQIEKWEWLSDSDGKAAAHFGLRLAPRDMLKIGRLVLQQGEWEGKQLVPKSWIRETSNHHAGSRRYRRQFWLSEYDHGDQKVRVIAAHGKGGQRILVIPELDAVVVGTAGHYDDNDAVAKSNKFFQSQIVGQLRLDEGE